MNDELKLVGKIKKLLALAGNNPNQEEAKSALLKAQQLMADNNLEVSIDAEDKIAYGMEIAVTKMNKAFRLTLAVVIANNFRCKSIILGDRDGSPIAFFGHENDAKICKEAFEFAYKTAKKNGDAEYKRRKDAGKETRNVFNSYVTGFIDGIRSSLDAQCVALMVIVPPDVKSEFQTRYNPRIHKGGMVNNKEVGMDFDAFLKGVATGKEMFTKKSIEG